jgi:hypothetical protein
LERLGLCPNDSRENLLICHNHELETALIDIKWTNSAFKERTTPCFIKLPIDDRAPPNRTRSQQSEQKPVKQRKQSVRANNVKQNQVQSNKKTTSSYHRTCRVKYCTSRDDGKDKNLRWRRIPPRNFTNPPIVATSNPGSLLPIKMKNTFRTELFRRLGCTKDTRADIRICSKHRVERIERNVEYQGQDGETKTKQITMFLPLCTVQNDNPVCMPVSSSTTTNAKSYTNRDHRPRVNRGVGKDRYVLQQIEKAKAMSLTETETNDQPTSMMLLSQILEAQEGNVQEMNDAVAQCIKQIGYKYNKIDYSKKR